MPDLLSFSLQRKPFMKCQLLVGKWKTIDDRTGYSRADRNSQKPDGTYEGIIVETRNIPCRKKW